MSASEEVEVKEAVFSAQQKFLGEERRVVGQDESLKRERASPPLLVVYLGDWPRELHGGRETASTSTKD